MAEDCCTTRYNRAAAGGIKVHTVVNADKIVPSLIWFSEAKKHDHEFLDKLKCDENTVYVFDKGYNDYRAFAHIITLTTIQYLNKFVFNRNINNQKINLVG